MEPSDVPEGPVIVDTDVFSFVTWQRGPWEAFADLIDDHAFVLSFATVGELRAGALKRFGEARRTRLDERISECIVATATDRVVSRYAELHAVARDYLGRDGSNDMWTAACALADDPPLPIVTNNLRDFERLRAVREFPLIHPSL